MTVRLDPAYLSDDYPDEPPTLVIVLTWEQAGITYARVFKSRAGFLRAKEVLRRAGLPYRTHTVVLEA